MSAPALNFAQVETVAAHLCHLSGGAWDRKGTRRALWRARAIALECLSRGDKDGAAAAMAQAPGRRKP